MELVQPGPLTPTDARDLAASLLKGDGVPCESLDITAEAIATSVGNVSFYIHRLVSRLPRNEKATPASVESHLRREITSDNNDWDLQHYRDGLRAYYGDDENLALHILDDVAADGTLSFEILRKRANARQQVDPERLRRLMQLLCRDHYLKRTDDNHYAFYLDLIRRWWRLNRSL